MINNKIAQQCEHKVDHKGNRQEQGGGNELSF